MQNLECSGMPVIVHLNYMILNTNLRVTLSSVKNYKMPELTLHPYHGIDCRHPATSQQLNQAFM